MHIKSAQLLGGTAESDSAYCDRCYHRAVCPSIHVRMTSYVVCHTRTPCQSHWMNDMPFDRDTHVVLSNTVLDIGLGANGKGRFRGWNPQFAAMPPITKLLLALIII